MLDRSNISNAREQITKNRKDSSIDIYNELKQAVNDAIKAMRYDASAKEQNISFKHRLNMSTIEFALFVVKCHADGVFVERVQIKEYSNDTYFGSNDYYVDGLRVTLI